ncbi:tetratricopeptide repeat protein [Nocardia sp. NBC_00416]|uniref:tetratricopeptide repeat protein n=1 Tax=Nocardia sp. NBC_00416 TaxID=2975991 RepID=UPI002E1CA3E3
MLTGDPLDTAASFEQSAPDSVDQPPTLATRYRSAEPIDWEGATVYPLYSEQLPTAAASLTVTLLSATPPTGLAGVGIGLTMVDGYIDIDQRHLTGVDIWRDALERGVTFDLSANAPGALFALTPVWADAAGEPRSWSGNYGIVVERTETGRTVLWCSMGEGPPHFADLVVEVRSTALDPHPRLFTPSTGAVPVVSVPAPRPETGSGPPRSDTSGESVAVRVTAEHHRTGADAAGPAVPDDAEVEGYPCSLSDLFLRTRDADDIGGIADRWATAPNAAPATRDPGTAILLTGPDEWYTRTAEHDFPDVQSPTGRHGWAEAPDETGLVPVISDPDLPDYGPEPLRSPVSSADPAVFPLSASYFAVPLTFHPAPDDEAATTDGHSMIDTIADDSFAPLPASETATSADTVADRHYGLGAVCCAQGDDEQACRLWAQAARAGHLAAAYDLGMLYFRHDEFDAAERWWRVAAGRRLIRAMAALSDLLEHRGAVTEARMWRTQAVAEEVIATVARPAAPWPVTTVDL